MPGEMGERSEGFVAPDYSKMESVELIEVARTLKTKAEIGRLNTTLLARLATVDRDDRDMTLAALQASQAQEEKLSKVTTDRNNEMVFEGSNPEVTQYSTEESLTPERVDAIFDEIVMNEKSKKNS
jgi:hypothetical protein